MDDIVENDIMDDADVFNFPQNSENVSDDDQVLENNIESKKKKSVME